MNNYHNNINYMSKMCSTSYIYIIRNKNDSSNIYKIGKTTNKDKTIKTFTTKYPIRKAFRPVDKSLADYVLHLILTILGPYRLFLKNSKYLDNAIIIDKKVLLFVIEWIINRTVVHKYEFRINYIPKTVASVLINRKKIPETYWHKFCENIEEFFPGIMLIPMDIDYHPQILCNVSNFDDFIVNYHQYKGITLFENSKYLKNQTHSKESIKHYFQVQSHQTPAMGYQTPAMGYQTPAMGYQTPAMGYQTPATSLAWNTPNIIQQQYNKVQII